MVLRVKTVWIHLPGRRSDHFSGPTPGFLHIFVKPRSLGRDRALIFNRSVSKFIQETKRKSFFCLYKVLKK